MVSPIFDDVRVDVVLRLQSIAKRFDPGTETFEAADHAAALALSARRSSADGTTLFFRAWRDAKRILRRRRRLLLDPLTPDSDLGAVIAEGGVAGAVGADSAADFAIAHDLESRICDAIDSLGPAARACLRGMLAGESVLELARRLGVAPRTVKRLRAKIREAARPFFLVQAA
jgi:DNA-directed RNA polymerase specialized sigma24 family protein